MATETNTSLSSIYFPLRVTFGLVPLLAGLDKFFNILADWPTYLYEASARRRKLRRVRLFDLSELENVAMSMYLSADEAVAETGMSELGIVLARAVDELPANLRAVFTVRIVEGLDTDETADCLNLTPSNVKTRLHRARSLLRNKIDKQIGRDVRRLYQFDGQRCDRIVERVLARLRRPRH